jgi:hypothetical protein
MGGKIVRGALLTSEEEREVCAFNGVNIPQASFVSSEKRCTNPRCVA